MTPVMVRYRVKPDRVAENERYIKKFSSNSMTSGRLV